MLPLPYLPPTTLITITTTLILTHHSCCHRHCPLSVAISLVIAHHPHCHCHCPVCHLSLHFPATLVAIALLLGGGEGRTIPILCKNPTLGHRRRQHHHRHCCPLCRCQLCCPWDRPGGAGSMMCKLSKPGRRRAPTRCSCCWHLKSRHPPPHQMTAAMAVAKQLQGVPPYLMMAAMAAAAPLHGAPRCTWWVRAGLTQPTTPPACTGGSSGWRNCPPTLAARTIMTAMAVALSGAEEG
jgi:hypothetical protein